VNSLERLIYMANQIGRNFATLLPDQAATATADHIAKFWDPRMRAMIFARLEAGGDGLDPVAHAAIRLLHDKGAPPPQTRATEFNAAGEAGHADAG
jgi:formate dehydrogenase subunit delta